MARGKKGQTLERKDTGMKGQSLIMSTTDRMKEEGAQEKNESRG